MCIQYVFFTFWENARMQVVSPSLYENCSLKDTVETLKDSNMTVTDAALINLVIKYFFAYVYPETVDQTAKLHDIEQLFGQVLYFFRHTNDPVAVAGSDADARLWHFMTNHAYGLSMLGDVAATVEIVKDIINRSIDPAAFDYCYTGLDLGTGTGILLLAQYIQALRNDFRSVRNIGRDINPYSVSRAADLATSL